ncbi:MAG TPA: M1 family metallopeptidase [Caulobacteraceae bacterium]|nr:M1 family metallopeptidase [Caulobacteraceae bacterium]
MRPLFVAAALGLLLAWDAARAADAPPNPYNPLVTFAPLALPDPPNAYRSADGSPGPAYWQNRADYQIRATLDPATKTLSGDEVITYTNNSPSSLDVLWLQLDQNTYRKDARSGAAGGFRRTEFTEGDVVEAVEVGEGRAFAPAAYVVNDTRMQVRLPAPLGHAGKVQLRIRWRYSVPGVFGGRTAWAPTRYGDVYDIAQWYPRMAVFDDVHGWDTLPYLGQEFYLEYGTFDYAITLPANMIVAGSGELLNPDEVLTPLQRSRLAAARNSDKTVFIRTSDEAQTLVAPAAATKTWRFHMEGARDVAFAASTAFVWDAARATLPGGKTALVQSVYPPEFGGDGAWGRSTEYLKFAVEEFSRRWYPYPWPNAINVGGPVGGMEYPAVLFDSTNDKGKPLFYLTVHEIGHTYFPMVVGTNERRWQWMDEGLNTFIDSYESDVFQGGVYGPKRDAEFAPGPGAPADQIAALIADPAAPPIMIRGDVMPIRYGHPISYFKTAYGLVLLREDILGPDRFDGAFRKFIRDWAYKHPTPSDFFRAMASEGGEDLDWFWRGWFFESWPLDMAVTGVTYPGGSAAKGASIDIANYGQLILPATLRATFADGSTRDVRVPAETWIQSGNRSIPLDSTQPLRSVVLDPDHRLPARDRAKMTWTPP